MPEQDQIRLLNSLGDEERSADVVEEMEPDDAAELLGEMPPEQRERLLTAMQSAYNLIGVAVCDTAGRLVGAVTVDDVLDKLLPANWRQAGGNT